MFLSWMGIVKGEIKIPELAKAIEIFKENRMAALEHHAERAVRFLENPWRLELSVELPFNHVFGS